MERLFQVFNFPFFPEVKTHGCLADFAHTPPPPRTDGPVATNTGCDFHIYYILRKGGNYARSKSQVALYSTLLTPAMPENYASSFYNNPFVSK